MKAYISVGIGDMMHMDAMMTPEEKSCITEIYWACRFGKCLVPLMENNPDYPNLRLSHLIHDELGKREMAFLEPHSIDFWHFRPDFPKSLATGLRLFGLEKEYKEGQLLFFDAIRLFYYSDRLCTSSSFLKYAKPTPYGDHILFHYPTSTRPRSDIATISKEDWQFVESLSQEVGLKVVVIADSHISVPLSNFELLVNPSLSFIVDLCASCTYYAGCDSFCSHLTTKRLSKEHLFIKSHESNILQKLLTDCFGRCYLPHPPQDIAVFYKPYLGRA